MSGTNVSKGTTAKPPVFAAAVAASLLMFVFGASYRVLAARLAAPVQAAPIEAAVLDRFPLQIGGWRGEEVPLDEAIIRRTDTDARLNRRYVRHEGSEVVSFYLAAGVKARDLMPHRPEVCYAGAGWTLRGRRAVELPLRDGTALPCNLLEFSRGALSTQRIVVLDYYFVDGQYCHDVSLLRSKAWRGSGAVRYVAQVQITASLAGAQAGDSMAGLVCAFAVDSAEFIPPLFENPGGSSRGNNSHEPKGQ